MNRELRNDTIRACRNCFMCRYKSPHFRATRLESRTPKGFAILLNEIDSGMCRWSTGLASIFYESTLGGEGKADCMFNWPEDELARVARNEIVTKGFEPENVKSLYKNLMDHGLLYKESPDNLQLNITTNRIDLPAADVLFLTGNTSRKEVPNSIISTAKILEALGENWTMLTIEQNAGTELYDLGYFDEAIHQAGHFVEMIANMRSPRIILLSTADTRAVRQWFPEWGIDLPEGISVRHVSEYLSEHIHELSFIDSDTRRTRVGYHDCSWLGRALGVYEKPRKILKEVIGEMPLEFYENREEALSAGAGTSVYMLFPELSQSIASLLVTQAEEIGMDTVVTANPTDAFFLAKTAHDIGSTIDFLELSTFIASGLRDNKAGDTE